MPPDVRSALRFRPAQNEFGAPPQQLGIAQKSDGNRPEGQRPSAHQTA